MADYSGKLKEVRGLGCSEASDGRVILVRVEFASKLSIVDLGFSLGHSNPKPEKRKKHAVPNLFAKIGVIELSFYFFEVPIAGKRL